MKCTRKGNKRAFEIFTGHCRQCKAEFEATRAELDVKYEFAHADCSECGASSGNAVILYPKK